MNEVIRAIQTRRTVRKFKQEPVPKEKMEIILDAGRWAPSFNNTQPWKFVVVQDRATQRELSEEAGRNVYYRGIIEAPATIVVSADTMVESGHWLEAGCLAHLNMALAAHSLGLGVAWIDIANTKPEEPIRRILGMPKSMRVISLMPVGFSDEKPEGTRKGLEDIVYYDKFSGNDSKGLNTDLNTNTHKNLWKRMTRSWRIT